MSFWGATVITRFARAFPYIGDRLVAWIWGGYSVCDATLKRFFIFHFFAPFILSALVVVHVVFLHETGSNNPLGIHTHADKIPFHRYFIIKDAYKGGVIIIFLCLFRVLAPDLFMDPENYSPANIINTPLHIQPE